jgi:hypothetical protein
MSDPYLVMSTIVLFKLKGHTKRILREKSTVTGKYMNKDEKICFLGTIWNVVYGEN